MQKAVFGNIKPITEVLFEIICDVSVW